MYTDQFYFILEKEKAPHNFIISMISIIVHENI